MTVFEEKVYEECKKIPKGNVSTYAKIARILHTSPRAVGNALAKNPYKDVPCHRVIRSDGSLGGYKGSKDTTEKRKLLKKEGFMT